MDLLFTVLIGTLVINWHVFSEWNLKETFKNILRLFNPMRVVVDASEDRRTYVHNRRF